MTSSPINLAIFGASGRMGQALLRLAADNPAITVVAAISRKPASAIDHNGVAHFSHAADLSAVPVFDVAIDFSLPEAFTPILETCLNRGAALVSGTTGLSATQKHALTKASTQIPILWSANFSLGVAVLNDLVARAAALLGDWQADIIESHHIHKKDAPSGTALALGRSIESAGHESPNYASLRAGDIVGEHTVQLAGIGERIELIHRATNRDIFAAGALKAASWLASQPPGEYAMRDLLKKTT